MKSFVILLLGMLLGACGTHTSTAVPSSAFYVPDSLRTEGAAALRTKTVALVEEEETRVRSYCAGVWVSDRTILTAAHCVADSEIGDLLLFVTSADVYPSGLAEAERPRAHVAKLYAFDASHDLAMLRTDAPPLGHGVARVRQWPIIQGMFAQTMGHPLGLWYTYSSGDVSAVRVKNFDDGAKLWLQTTAPIGPGNSGGGLFDEEGDLIGVCHGSFTRGQALNLFVHVQYIDALISEARTAGVL